MSELAKIFIVSVLNKQLKQIGESDAKGKILFVEFINDLNLLVQKWRSKFTSNDIESLVFDKTSVTDIISKTSFNDFITISSDWLLIDLDDNYHNQVKQLLATAILTYSHGLITTINQLGEKAQNLDSEQGLQVSKSVTETVAQHQTKAPELQDQTQQQIDTVMEGNDETRMEISEEKASIDSLNDTDRPSIKEETTDSIITESTNEPKSMKVDDPEEEENVKEAEKVAEIIDNEADMDRIVVGSASTSDEKKSEEESNEEKSDEEVAEIESTELTESDIKGKEDIAEVEESRSEDSDNEDDNESDKGQKQEESESEQEQEQEESKDAKETSNKRKSTIVSSQLHKRFQHIAVNLIDSIQAHRYSSPFLQQVSKRDAPDYYDVIYKPKDLKNILKAVKLKHDPPQYELIKQLEKDIILMFANCIMYNRSSDDLVKLTISMRDDVNNIFKLFEEAELDIK
jgi:bromodomain-containing protein 8